MIVWEDVATRLEGRIVVLEPLEPRHEAGLREAARDPSVWRWLSNDGREPPGPPDGWFEAALAESAAGREAAWATVLRATGDVVGSTRFLTLRPEHRGLEIGWTWLAPAAWGTGANAEAKLLQLAHAFDGLGCLRVEFKTDARNERSRAALAALGARFEGILRSHMLVPGTPGRRDSAYYSVIAEEWPEVRATLEARLSRDQPILASSRHRMAVARRHRR